MKLINTILLILITTISGEALAWEPTKPVMVTIAYAPGSGNEILFRKAVAILSRKTNINFIIEFKPGANEVVGTNHFLTTAKPDGHSLFVPAIGVWIANPIWYQKILVRDVMEVVPIVSIGDTPLAVYTHSSNPISTPAEFAALLKSQKATNIGTGSAVHAVMYQYIMKHSTNDRVERIQFNSPALVAQAVAGQMVEFGITPLSMALEWARSGRVRIIGATGSNKDYAKLTTNFPGLTLIGQVGIVAAANTPTDIVNYYRQLFNDAISTQEYRDFLNELAWAHTIPDFAAFIRDQRKQWIPIVKTLPFS